MAKVNCMLGRKIGMTQIFNENGDRVGVTVIEAGPCKVLQVKTVESDGYHAVQLGFGEKKLKNTTLPLQGHFNKADSTPKAHIREVRLQETPENVLGSEVKVDIFENVKKVDIQGTTKGKGFAGVMKRWNFRGQRASHGCSKNHRTPGALGRHMSINKGVPKGKRMSGHLGTETVTVQGLNVVKIDAEHNLLLVQGSVPGHNGALVYISTALQENARLYKEGKKK